METHSNMTKYFILGQLSRKEMSGYELMARLEQITGRKPSASQIYPVLKQMKALGYVTVRNKSGGRKKIIYYRLAVSGKLLLKDMSKRFESVIRAALGARLKVCAHCGCEIFKGAYRRGGKYFCCTSCAGSYKKTS